MSWFRLAASDEGMAAFFGASADAAYALGTAYERGKELSNVIPIVALKAVHREKPRERALSETEIEILWIGLPALKMSDDLKDIIRLTLILGQRVGELSGLAAHEIDLDRKLWLLAAERVKNGVPHSVPLPQLALDILGPRIEAGQKYVFPGRYDAK